MFKGEEQVFDPNTPSSQRELRRFELARNTSSSIVHLDRTTVAAIGARNNELRGTHVLPVCFVAGCFGAMMVYQALCWMSNQATAKTNEKCQLKPQIWLCAAPTEEFRHRADAVFVPRNLWLGSKATYHSVGTAFSIKTRNSKASSVFYADSQRSHGKRSQDSWYIGIFKEHHYIRPVCFSWLPTTQFSPLVLADTAVCLPVPVAPIQQHSCQRDPIESWLSR